MDVIGGFFVNGLYDLIWALAGLSAVLLWGICGGIIILAFFFGRKLVRWIGFMVLEIITSYALAVKVSVERDYIADLLKSLNVESPPGGITPWIIIIGSLVLVTAACITANVRYKRMKQEEE